MKINTTFAAFLLAACILISEGCKKTDQPVKMGQTSQAPLVIRFSFFPRPLMQRISSCYAVRIVSPVLYRHSERPRLLSAPF